MGIDYLLKDGLVIDGSSPEMVPKRADVAIEGDRIKETGNLPHIHANRTMNIKGLIVCPGFIDVHAHSEFILLADGRAGGKISQGITTEINGNCGLSAAPLAGDAREQRETELGELNITDRWHTFSEYFALLEKRKIATNFITLVGHGNLRASVVGYADKSLSNADRERMTELLRIALGDGAKGLSTGLIYPPGIYSETFEIIDLARETAKYGGMYATHMRSEGDLLLESVDEVIRIAKESKIRAHIAHLKTSGEKNWNKLNGVFEKIDRAYADDVSLTCDRYPYIASSTDLDSVLPSWAFEGGYKMEMKRLQNERDQLAHDILREHPEASFWQSIVIAVVNLERNKWMEGKSLAEISGALNRSVFQCLFDLLVEENLSVAAIFFVMNEENLKSILKRSHTVIGTDSAARSFDGITAKGKPHPRGFGSFPRVLGRYVREQKVFDISEAIYKMTGLPAAIFRIDRRGVIKKGFYADLAIFDPDTVRDTADFRNPFQRPEGIHHVFVNGVPVLLDGEVTGALPGRILK